MRSTHRRMRKHARIIPAFMITKTLAAAILLTSTIPFAQQDIAARSNVQFAPEDRWLARLVDEPVSARILPAVAGDASRSEIQTRRVVRIEPPRVGIVQPLRTNKAMKGDRFIRIASARFEPALDTETGNDGEDVLPVAVDVAPPMPQTADLPFEIPEAVEDTPLLAIARNIMSEKKAHALEASKVAERRRRIIAARVAVEPSMTAALAEGLVSRETTGSVNPKARSGALTLASAYRAQQEDAEPEAFSAIFSKPDLDKADEHVGIERPAVPTWRPKEVGLLRRIVLGPRDHKWAANRLPKNAFSKSQRRCLAIGVYFEARGESVKGQQAVAQVILNRVKNPAYPNTICGVVYQNKHMRNACQFSFTCDGIRDRIRSGRHWRIAKKVADDAVYGRVWLRKVGSSTHYHADYVWPRWRRKMKRLTKIGHHIFYRTRNGGWS